MPKNLQESKMQKGEAVVQHSGPVYDLWWHDKKYNNDLNLLCSSSPGSGEEGGRKKQNPVCVIHYNQRMGGDKWDQLLQMYLVERKRMNKL